MIDRAHIGKTWGPWISEVEKGRLRLFAKAVGETRPVYHDEAAARAAGYRSILAPLTFAYCLLADDPGAHGYLAELGIPTERILHGELQLKAFESICAGDRIRVTRVLTDVIVKKGGALEFAVFDTDVTNCDGDRPVARVRNLLAVRNAP